MRFGLRIPALLTALAAIGFAVIPAGIPAGAVAQDGVRARVGEGSVRAQGAPGGRGAALPSDADLAVKAQADADARQRTWDRKMKAATGGICTGC
jgi:hypothetical protein